MTAMNGKATYAHILGQRAAVVPLAPGVIGELLRLPAGNRVTSAQMSRDGTHILLKIEGPDMPLPNDTGSMNFVTVICAQETRSGDEGVQYRVMAHFAHLPDKKWVLRDWSHEK